MTAGDGDARGDAAPALRRRLPGPALGRAPRRARRAARLGRPGRLTPRRASTARLRRSRAEPNADRLDSVRARRRLSACPSGSHRRGPAPPASAASAGRFCDKLIDPAGCIEMGCRYLYSYEDVAHRPPLHGLRQQGLQRRDRPRPLPAGRQRPGGFGGIKMTGEPLPHASSRSSRPTRARARPTSASTASSSTARTPAPRRSGPSTCATRSVAAGRLGTGGVVEPSYLADSPICRCCHPRTAPRLHTLVRPTPGPA